MNKINETRIEEILRQEETAQDEFFGLIHEESGSDEAASLAFSGLFDATAIGHEVAVRSAGLFYNA